MASWSTGLFEVTAEPGGAMLFLKSWFCPCLVMGELNEKTQACPGGCFGGGLIGWFTGPFFMAVVAPKVNSSETPVMAFVYSCLPCTSPCYIAQVARHAGK